MLKKIALGALLTGLVAVLVWGAVIRTNAQSGENFGELSRAGDGETGRRGQTTESIAVNEETSRGGRWGQGSAVEQGAGTLSGVPQADVQPAEWLTIQGTVISVAEDLVEIRAAAGEVIPFEGRPLSYALEQGFSLKVGDAVALDGFDEDGEFKLGQVTNLGDGASITLRDASGRPAWAGGGRRG